jgi:hypothetical protein
MIEPEVGSTIRVRAVIMELFPAPVLKNPVSTHTKQAACKNSPPNNADLLTSIHSQGYALEYSRKFRSVFQDHIVDLDASMGWPGYRWLFLWQFMRCLLFNSSCIVDYTFHGVHVILEFCALPNNPTEPTGAHN